MIVFEPKAFVAEFEHSQVYNDKIKAFVDDILPLAFANAELNDQASDIDKCAQIQGLAARMLDYVMLCVKDSAPEDLYDMIDTMREGLFAI